MIDPLRSAVLVVAMAAVAMAGCATHKYGNKFDVRLVEKLTPGTSSSSDAIALLGKPTSESNYPDGRQLLYIESSASSSSSNHVAILFDAAQKMVRVSHKSAISR